MKRGFMDFVATRLIPDYPGQTAVWYAREYLKLFNDGSDAGNREQSLTSTLNKGVQTGQERRVWRKKIEGVYRYFPASMASNTRRHSSLAEVASFSEDISSPRTSIVAQHPKLLSSLTFINPSNRDFPAMYRREKSQMNDFGKKGKTHTRRRFKRFINSPLQFFTNGSIDDLNTLKILLKKNNLIFKLVHQDTYI